MQVREHVPVYIVGDLEVFYRRGRREEIVLRRCNQVLYSSRDLLAMAMAGQQSLNGMYLAYTNGAIPTDPVPPERLASYYTTTGSAGKAGFVRVPLVGEPLFKSTNPGLYRNNQIILTAISDNNTVIPTAENGIVDGVTQWYGGALGWLAPVYANDVLFSAVNFNDTIGSPSIPQIIHAAVGLRWTLTFYYTNPVPGSSSSSSL